MWHRFGDLRSPEVGKIMQTKPLVILPLGQTEEHGPHLPVSTDSVIASRLAQAIAKKLGERLAVILMETIVYGYSGKAMERWPGTIRVGIDTVRDYGYEICSSLVDMGANKIAIINGHGHHRGLMEVMARKLSDSKGVSPLILDPAGLASEALKQNARGGAGGSCHGGEFETSLMLFLEPHLVDMSKAADNPLEDTGKFPPGTFWSTWDRQKTEEGIYGKPTVASAETGKIFFDAAVTKAIECLEEYYRRGSALTE